MYTLIRSNKLPQSCCQFTQHPAYYSKGAVALLLKLRTGEKCNGGNWLFKSNCESTVWPDDLIIKKWTMQLTFH